MAPPRSFEVMNSLKRETTIPIRIPFAIILPSSVLIVFSSLHQILFNSAFYRFFFFCSFFIDALSADILFFIA